MPTHHSLSADASSSFRQSAGCKVFKNSINPVLFSVCLIGAVLILLYYYYTQVNLLTHDDIFFKYTEDGTYALALANYVNGRFIPGALYHLIAALGIHLFDYSWILQLLGYGALAFFAYTFVDKLRPETRSVDKMVCVLLIVGFPYNIAALSNKNNLANATIAFVALSAAVILFSSKKNILNVIGTTFLLLVVVSSYQTLVYYFFVFVCAYYLIQETDWGQTMRGIAVGAAMSLAAMAIYLLVHSLLVDAALATLIATENPTLIEYFGKSRGETNSLVGFFIAVFHYFVVLFRIAFWSEPILPIYVKLFAISLIAISYFLWVRDIKSERSNANSGRQPRRKRGLLVLALILLMGSPIHLFLADSWHPPHVFMHTGAVLVALFLLSYDRVPSRWLPTLRTGVAACTLLVALSTMLAMNDTDRLYRKDLALAATIMRDLESNPSFSMRKPLAIVGNIGIDSPHVEDAFNYFRINVSKFANGRSKYGVLEEAMGQRIPRPDAEFKEYAMEHCGDPAEQTELFRNSVTADGAIVCLPNRDEEAPAQAN